MPEPTVILIGGPTASGKTAYALRVAQETGAEIVGADSMQIYAGLERITAAPTAEERTLVRHHLIGVADPGEAWSVGRWLAAAKAALAEIAARGRPALVVGGTGLYFRALTHGLADIPPVARANSAGLSEVELRTALKTLDPEAERRISAGDRQRLVRAHAVATETGKPLSEWQAQTLPTLPQGAYSTRVLEPDHATLYARCDARLAAMVEEGVLDEVSALLERNLDPEAPAMKAVGVQALASHVRGEAGLEEALAAAQRETRNYAKRQLTWFRNQARDWERVRP